MGWLAFRNIPFLLDLVIDVLMRNGDFLTRSPSNTASTSFVAITLSAHVHKKYRLIAYPSARRVEYDKFINTIHAQVSVANPAMQNMSFPALPHKRKCIGSLPF